MSGPLPALDVEGPAPGRVAALGALQRWEDSPCSLLVLDATATTVLAANRTFLEWSGLPAADVVGSDFSRVLPVGDRILWSTHCLPKLEATGRVDEVSVQVVGSERRRAAFLTAHRHGSGAERGLVSVALFAATERRRYEEDLLAAKRTAEASEAHRARAEQGLQHLAHHDTVTGLLNRRGLQAALEGVLEGVLGVVHRDAGPTAPAVLFLDLDGFKAVNDSVGHAGGDELLATVAQRLLAGVRAGAVVARFAGDEFVVVDHLPEAGDVDALCQRLLAAVAAPVLVKGVEVVLTASIGVSGGPGGGADLPAAPGAAAEVLLHRADAAMYRVKGAGRSGWQVHDPSATDSAADRLRLLEQLRHAVRDGQLRLHHQPRVRLSDGATTGVEALVRWQHPTRGLLAPAEFIDVAETSGLVRELGAWVLDAAVAQAAAWRAEGLDLQVGVNVSARQLADPGLLGTVTSALARHAVPAAQLLVEITETALLLEPEAAERTLRALSDLGVRVAVDDFGTGYASLTYLRRFPVHELKIDRSFVAAVADEGGDGGDRAIVTACVDLARALGLVSVAEGVETPAQHAVLVALGCDTAQGYLYGRPRPAEEVTGGLRPPGR